MLKARTATVLQDHPATDELPLTLQPGDKVSIKQPHPEREGYAWAADGGFCAGWVPLCLFDCFGRVAVAKCAYSSHTLNVQQGDSVRIYWKGTGHDDYWCENREGDRGWLPASSITLEDPAEGDAL